MADNELQDKFRYERELREMWEKEHERRHVDEQVAVNVAAHEINRRLDAMNELRSQIDAERGKYVTREMYDKEHAALRDSFDERLKTLEVNKSNLEGRIWALGAAISASVVILQAVLYFVGHR